MEDSVAVKANRKVEAMGEVGDAAGDAGAGNGGVKKQAKGEGEGGEAGDAAEEVGGDGMGEAGAAIQVRNRYLPNPPSSHHKNRWDDAQRAALMRHASNLQGMYGSNFNPLLAKSWRSLYPEKRPDGIKISGVEDRSAQSIYLEINKLYKEGSFTF